MTKPKKHSLSEKRSYAQSRGYVILEDSNFNVKETVRVLKEETGEEFETNWYTFSRGSEPTRTTLEHKRRIAEERGYTLKEDKNFNNKKNVTVCSPEGEYIVKWENFVQGATPKITTLRQKKKQAEERGYTLLETHNFKIWDLITLRNNETGKIYKTRYGDFLQGKREREVSVMSKGEAVIYAFLETNLRGGYTFSYEEPVELREGRKGRFDFAVKEGGKVVAYIEYNGIQHYKKDNFFGEEHYNLTKESDELKRRCSEQSKIPLIVVPYTIKNEVAIAKFIQKTLPEYIHEELKPFKTNYAKDEYHTSLEEKKEFAKARGYELLETENFPAMSHPQIKNKQTGVTGTIRWDNFTRGAKLVKEEHSKRIRLSLDDKRRIAAKMGYELLETENFTVKKKVRLRDIDTGEIRKLQWEPIQARYRKAFKEAGIDL